MTRARGFAPWYPQPSTLRLLGQVNDVLREYQTYLPLTIRQVFYRLVGAHGYQKDQHAYLRLCEVLTKARRARLIAMTAIRDDGVTHANGTGFRDGDQFLAEVRELAGAFRLDRSSGQSKRLVVLCEAAGMVPQLARVCDPYDVSAISSGGFDSVTAKYDLAVTAQTEGRPVEFLHIGDHDPSGVHLFRSLHEDVAAFVGELGGEVSFTRLAITPEQMRRYRLPTAPRKASDNRAFHGQTCQAEALAPDVLANIVRSAIEQRSDQKQYARVLKREGTARKRLLAQLATIARGKAQ